MALFLSSATPCRIQPKAQPSPLSSRVPHSGLTRHRLCSSSQLQPLSLVMLGSNSPVGVRPAAGGISAPHLSAITQTGLVVSLMQTVTLGMVPSHTQHRLLVSFPPLLHQPALRAAEAETVCPRHRLLWEVHAHLVCPECSGKLWKKKPMTKTSVPASRPGLALHLPDIPHRSRRPACIVHISTILLSLNTEKTGRLSGERQRLKAAHWVRQ